MKQSVFFIFLYLMSTLSSVVQAQTEEKARKWSIEVGLSTYLQGDGGNFFGGMGGVAYYISERSRLSFDFGGYSRSQKIGEFSYTVRYMNGDIKTYYDGIIDRNYSTNPFVFTWMYEFDLQPKFFMRVGPSIGMTMLSASDEYTPSDVEGKPGSNSEHEGVFTFGASLGFSYFLFNNSGLNFAYRLLGNSSTTFEFIEIKPIAHQLSLSYFWRL